MQTTNTCVLKEAELRLSELGEYMPPEQVST